MKKDIFIINNEYVKKFLNMSLLGKQEKSLFNRTALISQCKIDSISVVTAWLFSVVHLLGHDVYDDSIQSVLAISTPLVRLLLHNSLHIIVYGTKIRCLMLAAMGMQSLKQSAMLERPCMAYVELPHLLLNVDHESLLSFCFSCNVIFRSKV